MKDSNSQHVGTIKLSWETFGTLFSEKLLKVGHSPKTLAKKWCCEVSDIETLIKGEKSLNPIVNDEAVKLVFMSTSKA